MAPKSIPKMHPCCGKCGGPTAWLRPCKNPNCKGKLGHLHRYPPCAQIAEHDMADTKYVKIKLLNLPVIIDIKELRVHIGMDFDIGNMHQHVNDKGEGLGTVELSIPRVQVEQFVEQFDGTYYHCKNIDVFVMDDDGKV